MVDQETSWIKLHRNLLINDLWKDETFSRGQAWVDLLLMANWKDGNAIIKGTAIPIERGQLCRSMKQLSIRWGWSVGKVKRFLEMLSKLQQISVKSVFKERNANGTQMNQERNANETQKNAITTLITITNYDNYQASGTQTERKRNADESRTERKRNANGTQTETDKEIKKEKKEKKEVFSLPEWVPNEEWNAYLEMRVKIKRPMTMTAQKLAIGKLEKLKNEGHDPKEVLDQSVLNSWQSLYPIKDDISTASSGVMRGL